MNKQLIVMFFCLTFCIFLAPFSFAMNLHIATNGNDAWTGEIPTPNAKGTNGPLETLTGARDAIRTLHDTPTTHSDVLKNGIKVLVHEGTYTLDKPFKLEKQDSGTLSAPIVYSAVNGDNVRFIGGHVINNFTPITDDKILNRLDASARKNILHADLSALGINNFGSPKSGGIEVFFDGQPMHIARWPNNDFTKIVDIVVKDGHQRHGLKGSMTPKFIYDDQRANRWVEEPDLWAHGYWFWDWSEQRMKVNTIDTKAKTFTLSNDSPHPYGFRKGQWYYVYNALSELDEPGEWYLDRDKGQLYFWPPKPIEQAEVLVSVIPSAIEFNNVQHITLQGFIIEATRSTAVKIKYGNNISINGCTIRNTGGNAINIGGGEQHSVIGCDITQTGKGGISLNGGNRTTLEAAGHLAENNHIHHYARNERTYQPAIRLSGVGNIARNNLIDNAPHVAIIFTGNDHLIELNEIHSVTYESNDAGAIYSGRNWTMRGNIIRQNYLHHITGFEQKGSVGIYLDDMFSSAEMISNIFYKVARAVQIGGGRDNKVENNLFIDCEQALNVDARAMGWAHYMSNRWIIEQKEKGTISGIAYDQPPYSKRYPALANIFEGTPQAPEGNSIRKNISWGGKWDNIQKRALPYIDIADNMVEIDPLFMDIDKGDFRLKENSPAFEFGFKEIPSGKIGLYKSNTRASWPVSHKVR
jgi:hypothetical protein